LKWAFGPEQQLGEIKTLDKDKFLLSTRQKIDKLKEQKSMFYETLHTIHRHYPPIVDTFLNRILHDYPHLISRYKTQSLDMICKRLEVIEQKWLETSVLGLERLIMTSDQIEQTLALTIVTKMLPELTPPQALDFVSKVSQILQDSAPETREKAYELLMQVFIRFKGAEKKTDLTLKKLAVSGLVRGLSDQDPSLQKKVLDFWQKYAVDRSRSLQERIVDWMDVLYVNESANLFVGSYMELLLEELTSSPDYNKKIFEHNLGDCHYNDMEMLLSWRTQHATMQPLFVETQASQALSQSLSSSGSLGAGYLRATQQTLAFEPTLAEATGN